jgi:Mg-chelatase subunit ChlI
VSVFGLYLIRLRLSPSWELGVWDAKSEPWDATSNRYVRVQQEPKIVVSRLVVGRVDVGQSIRDGA